MQFKGSCLTSLTRAPTLFMRNNLLIASAEKFFKQSQGLQKGEFGWRDVQGGNISH